MQLLALARSTIQSTLLARLCRQLCAALPANSQVVDASLFSLLADHVPDAATRATLLARASAAADADGDAVVADAGEYEEMEVP